MEQSADSFSRRWEAATSRRDRNGVDRETRFVEMHGRPNEPKLSDRHRERKSSSQQLNFSTPQLSHGLQRLVRPYRVHVEIFSLKESTEERRRFIRDADNLVRGLTIEFKIELSLGSTVIPV
jgi:hypothetical protein